MLVHHAGCTSNSTAKLVSLFGSIDLLLSRIIEQVGTHIDNSKPITLYPTRVRNQSDHSILANGRYQLVPDEVHSQKGT